MDVHQTGDHICAVQIHPVLMGCAVQHMGKAAVFHGKAALPEMTVHKNTGMIVIH